MYVLTGIIGTMLAFLACLFDFLNGLASGEVRFTGIFVGINLFVWLIVLLDNGPSKGCR